MFARMRMFGPRRASRVQPRETAGDDPHDSIAEEPSEQVAHTLEQIALTLSAIDRNLESLAQGVLALARQQSVQIERMAALLAMQQPMQQRAEPARPDRRAERKRQARTVSQPDTESPPLSAGTSDAKPGIPALS
jgi:hypothetical protein